MRIEEELKLDFQDVLIRPKRSTLTSRSEVDISREFVFRHSGRDYRGVPIIAANMDTVGTFEMARALGHHRLCDSVAQALRRGRTGRLLPHAAADRRPCSIRWASRARTTRSSAASRTRSATPSPTSASTSPTATPRPSSASCTSCARPIPDITIMAGNVVTGEMTEELILDGVDIVKVGIGPGSVCTTRKMTGVGYPQLSAIIECADAAHGLRGLICADGGCTSPGDLAKAFGAGADFVMLGGMLAGHDECMGETSSKQRRTQDALLRHELARGDGQALRRRRQLPRLGGQGSPARLPRPGGKHAAGHPRRCALGLHLRRRPPLKELSKRTTFIRVARQLNEVFGQS
jgi:GMP reductase